MQTNDGRLTVVSGKSRSGKTAAVLRDLRRRKIQRAIAWDPDGQWSKQPGWRRYTSLRELAANLWRGGKSAYVPSIFDPNLKVLFNEFCKIAFGYGDMMCERGIPVAVILEEIADVSSPGKAEGYLGRLLRTGLKRYLFMYPISQRWAEADKTALNNPTAFIFCSMMPMDVDYMAKRSGLSANVLGAIKKTETKTHIMCEVVHFEVDSAAIRHETMTFKKPSNKAPSKHPS